MVCEDYMSFPEYEPSQFCQLRVSAVIVWRSAEQVALEYCRH